MKKLIVEEVRNRKADENEKNELMKRVKDMSEDNYA